MTSGIIEGIFQFVEIANRVKNETITKKKGKRKK